MGFQPEAEHLPEGPEPVDDTVEVKEAKSNFYSLYKEMEDKLEEVAKEDKVEEEQLVADGKNSILNCDSNIILKKKKLNK